MNDLETQLKALQTIHEAPSIPFMYPVATTFDNKVAIPPRIEEYLKRSGQMPKLESDNRIDMLKYVEVMENSGIPYTGIPWAFRYEMSEKKEEILKLLKDGR